MSSYAHQRGWDAARAGAMLDDNPYSFGSEEYASWRQGWWEYTHSGEAQQL